MNFPSKQNNTVQAGKSMGDHLQAMLPQIRAALPRQIDPGRFVRIAVTTFQTIPGLADCTPASFLGCVIQSAQLGLEPGSPLGEAYIIPYKGVATLQIGYKGLGKLAFQSGQLARPLVARCVHVKDVFEYQYGVEETIRHIPCNEEDPGELIFSYAIAHFKDGGYQFVVLPKSEIARIMKRSQSANNPDPQRRKSSPWYTDPEPMWAKSAAKQLAKWLPLSTELGQAVHLDDQGDAGIHQGLEALVEGGVMKAIQGPEESLSEVAGSDTQEPPAEQPAGWGGRAKAKVGRPAKNAQAAPAVEQPEPDQPASQADLADLDFGA